MYVIFKNRAGVLYRDLKHIHIYTYIYIYIY